MKQYARLVDELWGAELKILQLKEEHKAHVLKHLVELERELKAVNMCLNWCASDNFNMEKANYSVDLYSDSNLMFCFIVDAYNPANFKNFKKAFKEATGDYIRTRKMWLELQDEVKPKREINKTMKI